MSKLDTVLFIPRDRKEDHRGWLLKIIDGKEPHLPDRTGEVYLTLALAGQVRGNHYHRLTAEWFTVILGQAQLILGDPATGERREHILSAGEPVTVYVPPGIVHAFFNPADSPEPLLLAAYADHFYDPADTIPWELI